MEVLLTFPIIETARLNLVEIQQAHLEGDGQILVTTCDRHTGTKDI